jgi:hypothetical protein
VSFSSTALIITSDLLLYQLTNRRQPLATLQKRPQLFVGLIETGENLTTLRGSLANVRHHSALAIEVGPDRPSGLVGPGSMTDKPEPVTLPSQPTISSRGLVLPANCRDMTAERVGTVIGIVGATAAEKGTKPG